MPARPLPITFAFATPADAAEIARLSTHVARHLKAQTDRNATPSVVSEKTVLTSLKTSRVLLARQSAQIVAFLRLSLRKPWAIDPAYFTPVPTALYLTNLAVDPAWQRQGIGRQILDAACVRAAEWPAHALRLDAFANATGAGPFYTKCGWREVARVTYRRTPLIYYEFVLSTASSPNVANP